MVTHADHRVLSSTNPSNHHGRATHGPKWQPPSTGAAYGRIVILPPSGRKAITVLLRTGSRLSVLTGHAPHSL